MTLTGLWNTFWKDKEGKVVIWQRPNLPLWAWFICSVLAFFFHGGAANILGILSFGALITWSLLEVFSGVNYFRRILGVVVLLASIYTRIVR